MSITLFSRDDTRHVYGGSKCIHSTLCTLTASFMKGKASEYNRIEDYKYCKKLNWSLWSLRAPYSTGAGSLESEPGPQMTYFGARHFRCYNENIILYYNKYKCSDNKHRLKQALSSAKSYRSSYNADEVEYQPPLERGRLAVRRLRTTLTIRTVIED